MASCSVEEGGLSKQLTLIRKIANSKKCLLSRLSIPTVHTSKSPLSMTIGVSRWICCSIRFSSRVTSTAWIPLLETGEGYAVPNGVQLGPSGS